jgi:hypothetical protein
MMLVTVAMTVIMIMTVMATAEEPHTCKVHQQTDDGNGDRLAEMDGYGAKEPRHRLVADQQRNHRQRDSACETCQVAQLACAEHEAGIPGVLARVRISECRDQHCARVRRHVQTVGDERE